MPPFIQSKNRAFALLAAHLALCFGLCAPERAGADEPAVAPRWNFSVAMSPGLNEGENCGSFGQFALVPFFDFDGKFRIMDLVAPADWLAQTRGAPAYGPPAPGKLETPAMPELHTTSQDQIQVSSVVNPATGRKFYSLKIGGSSTTAPTVSGKGGQLDASTYAGHGQVFGLGLDASLYSGPDATTLAHDLRIPLVTYQTRDGVKISGVVVQSSRFSEGEAGDVFYAVATGGGVSLHIPGTDSDPAKGFHLDFGAAPSLTNAKPHGNLAPLAAGAVGFDW